MDSFLKRETSSGGNQKTFTVSAWVKLQNRVGSHTIFSSDVEDDGSNYGSLSIEGTGLVKYINMMSGSLTTNYQSTRLLVDSSSWYHIVLRVDTTQATASNRIRIYVNSEQLTNWDYSTTPNQNTDTGVFKSGNATLIGARHSTSSHNYWSGEMTHIHIVDGTSYAPTTFGETDSTTGEWKPKTTVSVTYGTNGAFLKFENSGALGTDSSGNSNTFTVSGSLKQLVDTPTNNFPVFDIQQHQWNDKIHYGGYGLLSYANSYNSANLTQMVKNGKWYFEVKSATDNTGENYGISFYKNGTRSAYSGYAYQGGSAIQGRQTAGGLDPQGWSYFPNRTSGGSPYFLVATSSTNYGTQASANDIIMVAVDLSTTNIKIWLGRNGTWFNAPGTSDVGNPASGTNVGYSGSKGDDFWGIAISSSDNEANNSTKYTYINMGNGFFGTTAVASANADGAGVGIFEYAVPSGFYAICSSNIKTYG